MVRSPTGRSATQLSMAYFPDISDISIDMPSFNAGAIGDTTLQLPAMDDDASFQIPIAANQSELLHMGDHTFLRGADTMMTPYAPRVRQEPLTLGDLTPQPAFDAAHTRTPRRSSSTPKFKPTPKITRGASRSPQKPSPLKKRFGAGDQNTPDRPLRAVFGMPKEEDLEFATIHMASPSLAKLKADIDSLACSPPQLPPLPTAKVQTLQPGFWPEPELIPGSEIAPELEPELPPLPRLLPQAERPARRQSRRIMERNSPRKEPTPTVVEEPVPPHHARGTSVAPRSTSARRATGLHGTDLSTQATLITSTSEDRTPVPQATELVTANDPPASSSLAVSPLPVTAAIDENGQSTPLASKSVEPLDEAIQHEVMCVDVNDQPTSCQPAPAVLAPEDSQISSTVELPASGVGVNSSAVAECRSPVYVPTLDRPSPSTHSDPTVSSKTLPRNAAQRRAASPMRGSTKRTASADDREEISEGHDAPIRKKGRIAAARAPDSKRAPTRRQELLKRGTTSRATAKPIRSAKASASATRAPKRPPTVDDAMQVDDEAAKNTGLDQAHAGPSSSTEHRVPPKPARPQGARAVRPASADTDRALSRVSAAPYPPSRITPVLQEPPSTSLSATEAACTSDVTTEQFTDPPLGRGRLDCLGAAAALNEVNADQLAILPTSGPSSKHGSRAADLRPPTAKLTVPVEFNFTMRASASVPTSAAGSGSVEPPPARVRSRSEHGRSVPDFASLHAAHDAAVTAARSAAVKPVVPVPFNLRLGERAKERDAFERARQERETRLAEDQRREQEAAEEEWHREARRRAVPRAHAVPDWYKDLPKRK